jgi:hypothetical protein
MRPNSLRLCVSTVRVFASAVAAISRSWAPTTWPAWSNRMASSSRSGRQDGAGGHTCECECRMVRTSHEIRSARVGRLACPDFDSG